MKHASARFGFYLFRHELSGTDPRNPEDFGHAARAARLGIK